jgi:hypothetical protein
LSELRKLGVSPGDVCAILLTHHDVDHIIESIVRPQKPAITGTYDTTWPYKNILVLHAPGHTIFQFQDVVFTGDLFKYIDGHFRPFPGFMNWGQDKAKESLSSLKCLKFEWLKELRVWVCDPKIFLASIVAPNVVLFAFFPIFGNGASVNLAVTDLDGSTASQQLIEIIQNKDSVSCYLPDP